MFPVHTAMDSPQAPPATLPASMLRAVYRDAKGSPIRAMLALASEKGVISLAGGHPDPSLLPLDWLLQAAQESLEKLDSGGLQYGPTEGIRPLRESVCAILATRQIAVVSDDVLITTGSQQAIALMASVLIEPGETVAMARFNYPAAQQAFKFAGANIVVFDDEADELARIARDARQGPVKAVYLVPNFANPTGHVMSVDARRRLLTVAARERICVIEDDPYGELWFDRPPPDSLYALNQRESIDAHVAYVTSFSKILVPALRLGAVVAPAAIRRALVVAKQAADLHSGLMEQGFLDSMLRSPILPAHLLALRNAYRVKARAMVDALRRDASGLLTFRDPSGGMFVWATLAGAQGVLTDIDWFAFGRKYSVLALPGEAFSDGGTEPYLRLSFANPGIEAIREGVRRLSAGLVAEMNLRRCAGLSAPANPVSGGA